MSEVLKFKTDTKRNISIHPQVTINAVPFKNFFDDIAQDLSPDLQDQLRRLIIKEISAESIKNILSGYLLGESKSPINFGLTDHFQESSRKIADLFLMLQKIEHTPHDPVSKELKEMTKGQDILNKSWEDLAKWSTWMTEESNRLQNMKLIATQNDDVRYYAMTGQAYPLTEGSFDRLAKKNQIAVAAYRMSGWNGLEPTLRKPDYIAAFILGDKGNLIECNVEKISIAHFLEDRDFIEVHQKQFNISLTPHDYDRKFASFIRDAHRIRKIESYQVKSEPTISEKGQAFLKRQSNQALYPKFYKTFESGDRYCRMGQNGFKQLWSKSVKTYDEHQENCILFHKIVQPHYKPSYIDGNARFPEMKEAFSLYSLDQVFENCIRQSDSILESRFILKSGLFEGFIDCALGRKPEAPLMETLTICGGTRNKKLFWKHLKTYVKHKEKRDLQPS